jgi:hypothetical protein
MEVPFEVKIKYQDVTGTRKFESTVKMIYSPAEERFASGSIGSNVAIKREYKIIRLDGTTIRRLA